MTSPEKLSHLVLKTYRVEEMRAYYCTLLGAHVTFEDLPAVSFITYDEEHHRMGFALIPGEPVPNDGAVPGLAHTAFAFADIRTLLTRYGELSALGIRPRLTVHHGPTVSFYYRDPDRNNIELFVDAMSVEEGTALMSTPAFKRNPLGVEVDADALLALMKAGASDAELLAYDSEAKVDLPELLRRYQTELSFGISARSQD